MRGNPEKYLELFKVYEILLIDGILNVEFVNSWADKILENEEESEYCFIEISTTKNINELITILNKSSINCDNQTAERAVFGILHEINDVKGLELKKASKMVSKFAYTQNLAEFEKSFLYGLDDSIQLAEDRIYGDINILSYKFFEFLKIYDCFTWNNYENWKKLSANLEINLSVKIEKVMNLKSKKKSNWWKF